MKYSEVIQVEDLTTEQIYSLIEDMGYTISASNGTHTVLNDEGEIAISIKCSPQELAYAIEPMLNINLRISFDGVPKEEVVSTNYPAFTEEVKDGVTFQVYNLSMLTEMECVTLINTCDFTLYKQINGLYHIEDNQGANYGGINHDKFTNIKGIIDRMAIYWMDHEIIFV